MESAEPGAGPAGTSIIIGCPACGKKTPRLLAYVAAEYWNIIAHGPLLDRGLVYNEWGVCMAEPVETVLESHGKNYIHITVYQEVDGFLAGFDFSIESMKRAEKPHIRDVVYKNSGEAKTAVKNMIKSWCWKDKVTRVAFLDFIVINYNQLELFG